MNYKNRVDYAKLADAVLPDILTNVIRILVDNLLFIAKDFSNGKAMLYRLNKVTLNVGLEVNMN